MRKPDMIAYFKLCSQQMANFLATKLNRYVTDKFDNNPDALPAFRDLIAILTAWATSMCS